MQPAKGGEDSAKKLVAFLVNRRRVAGLPIDLRTDTAMYELAAILSADLSDVRQAVLGIDAKNATLETFIDACIDAAKERERIRTISRRAWTFLLPLTDVVFPRNRIRFTARDNEFLVVNRSTANRLVHGVLNDQNLLEQTILIRKPTTPDWYLILRASGDSWTDAWTECLSGFEVLMGALEFTVNHFTWRYGGGRTTRARVPHPSWILAVDEQGVVSGTYFHVDEPSGRSLTFSPAVLKSARKLLRTTAGKENRKTTANMIADCLRLYADALSEGRPSSCFLALWQLAERLTLVVNKGGNTVDVCSRLEWHGVRVGLPGSGFKFGLSRVAEARNRLVHHGREEGVGDEEVNLLKLACEAALDWVIASRLQLPTEIHHQEFYRYRTQNTTYKSAVMDALGYLEK